MNAWRNTGDGPSAEAGMPGKHSQARLAESHQLLTAVLGYTHMMAAFLDPQFNFIWVNRAYADSCRREPSFFPGKNHFELYPHAENQAIFQRVVETGQPFFVAARPFEYPDQPDRGTSYWDWSLIPVTDEGGKTTGLVLTLADVTQRKESEARLRSLESQLNHASRLASLGELAAGIAHEVNQPLCAIVNFARACGNLAAQDAPDLARIREWSDAIASTAADAGEIIRRVIRFARRAQPDRELVRVRELVDNAILLIHHEAEQRRVVIRANAIGEDLMVYVQSVSIQQVLVNLLCNGIESLEAVPPDNRVVCVHAAPRGDLVEITVSDNGAGLNDDYREKIFEPFFTTKPQGLGLGLPLSRTIVDENAGRIWTTDNKAGGLTVHFTLPTRKE